VNAASGVMIAPAMRHAWPASKQPPPGMRIQKLNDSGRPVGELHFHAKLSDADVDLIHELRDGGMSLSMIAKKFGVQKAAVWKIVHGINRCQLATRTSLVPVDRKTKHRKETKRTVQPRPAQAAPEPVPPTPGLELQQTLNGWR